MLDLKNIKQTLTKSLSNDEQFRSELPLYEDLDHPKEGQPPLYSNLPTPPRYDALFTEQFILSESKLIFDVIWFCRETNDERVATLTNALVSLMSSNWKIKNSGNLPIDYTRGSAAQLSRLARQLKRDLNMP
jgi:hypothetical protein